MNISLTQPGEHPGNQIPVNIDPLNKPVGEEARFIPKGAIAFFVLLVMLCLVIWFGIYFLMLSRI